MRYLNIFRIKIGIQFILQLNMVHYIKILGTSYEEFLRRCEFADSHLIFIRDQDGADFGAFVSESWKMSKNKFFGTGETFLFKVQNGEAVTFKST